MYHLELKIPPPIVILVCGIVIALFSLGGVLPFAFPGMIGVAVFLAFLGFVICLVAFLGFQRAKTTWKPEHPEKATTLVTNGIYRFSRNPMYLGWLFVLLGWAIFWGDGLAFIILPFYVFYLNRFQIVPEERALQEKFGDEYTAYKSKVRRWL